MNSGFWEKLRRPIIALAPMANVTDAAFRRIIAKYGKPDIFFTEFVSADGLVSAGREKLLVDLLYSESERPIVAQLFSGNPEKMREAAALVKKLGFDGLDINMGCPDRSIERSGAGAALIKNPKLAREIIRAAQAGLVEVRPQQIIPVSIKTRLGYNKDELESWLPALLAENPAAITIHARTRREMSKVLARWERVKRAVEIRDELKSETLILGNGDLRTVEEAREKVRETRADGAMLGRAIFGNPFLFSKSSRLNLAESARFNLDDAFVKVHLRVMLEHTKLFEKLFMHPPSLKLRRASKNFAVMKKHFKAYSAGFDGAKELRTRLMETTNAEEVKNLLYTYRYV